ncbi:hypothetical protein GCM10011531_18270 [Aquaticitalea lipolytica]|uniref:Uncharacterized protein n=1 Tax=Aquaticitalea lipolytica TaxID=1247562 RepID=A0A8J2XG93_9FLAO|nr:DUF6090 family protein [Aquaticitalea lipolytica]GFZ87333.1 hypothetical protein GCM10011531_18270 [Aquaticitalea lipolytica]
MIKFFRNIRKNLLTDGKTTKYFKYAIGEIVLVVIGILIALQINNWNENRKQESKVNNYLNSMVIDLSSDIKAYDRIIESYELQVENNTSIFKDKNYQEFHLDSIVSNITSYYAMHQIVDQTYQKIKNSGLSDNLGSKELNDAINNYYFNGINSINTFLQYDKERSTRDDDLWFLTNNYEINISHQATNTINLPFLESEEARKKAIIATIESNLGRNYLRHNINRKRIGIIIAKQTKTEAEVLIQLIKDELNN